ncbi:alcohol dehydrogenase catalytic domain-containing protein [Demequina sp. SYSU T00192]|uniref:Alcohol dehydrogenase catalytic domain-containing protein n=1 Tax=Demequina litoralis TaxID=3051660 RepID=A0ABT8G780_9MICO|nr:alcohol dehydrogenase catalytic domain-containing protein [Demequina sp. SYSU T00192]MDN4474774.1 alcohol dehydrogenase catalytic domain-containing protein [Demequina sp. SYSU T00192]
MTVPDEMSAVVFDIGGGVRVDRVPVPSPAPGEVLVEVAAVGICGTDLHLRGGDHVSRDGDLVPGHELAGVVVAVAAGVAGVAVGDAVAVDPNIPCGGCRQCHRGRRNLCERYSAVGVTRPGAAARYVAVPAACCVVLPASLAQDRDALALMALAEPLSCAVRGVDVLQPQLADHVLVYGAGTMGLMVTALLAGSGAATVTVVDPNLDKAEGARALGATAVAGGVPDLDPADVPDGGWDIVVDCTGVPAAIADGLDRVGRGGTFLQFGVAPTAATVEVSPHRIYRDEISIVGSMAVLDSFSRAVDLLLAGRVDPEPYVSHRVPLEGYADALDLFARGATRKVLVLPA